MLASQVALRKPHAAMTASETFSRNPTAMEAEWDPLRQADGRDRSTLDCLRVQHPQLADARFRPPGHCHQPALALRGIRGARHEHRLGSLLTLRQNESTPGALLQVMIQDRIRFALPAKAEAMTVRQARAAFTPSGSDTLPGRRR